MKYAVNRFLVRDTEGKYTGLALATTEQEAEDWADEMGIEGEIVTREDYAQTPEGAAEAAVIAQGNDRKREAQDRADQLEARRKRLKQRRKQLRGIETG